jgi:hypothetical protein
MSDFEVNAKSKGELIEKLRHVTLRGSGVQPYLNSYISIETLDPRVLDPTQRYCLIGEIKKIEQLRWAIEYDYGFDILRLNGYLEVTYPERSITPDQLKDLGDLCPEEPVTVPEHQIDILPPVIEEYIDPFGKLHLIVCDGQHRCRLAYQMGVPINVVYVRGVHSGYPYYAHVLPRGWDDVELITNLTEGYVKKFHVQKNHKALYRDFNSVFSNIGDSRPYEAVGDNRKRQRGD